MLFKQQNEISSFSIDELFKEKNAATGLIVVDAPEVLR